MTCPQEGLQLLAAFVGVLLIVGKGPNPALAGEFFRGNPFVRFTDLKGFAPVCLADARLVQCMRHAARSIAATGEGRSLVLGVQGVVDIALFDEPFDQLFDRRGLRALPFPFANFSVQIIGQFFPARCISFDIAYSQPVQALLV